MKSVVIFLEHKSHWGLIMGILLTMCGQTQLKKPDESSLEANISLIILIIIGFAGPNYTIYILGLIVVSQINPLQ